MVLSAVSFWVLPTFSLCSISKLPFEIESVKYLSYWGNLAEIKYIGETQSCIFRQSLGEEDNSGDYNKYDVIEEHNINGIDVLLKGESRDKFISACWINDGKYFYMRFSNSVTLEMYENIISNIIE